MRIRNAVALLALCFFTASSWASLCDISCAFAQFHPTRHSMNHSRSAESFDANRNMPAHADHGCCRNGDRESAIRAPHLAMSPDCAVDPSLRLQLPTPTDARAIPAAAQTFQIVVAPVASPSAAETPSLGPQPWININLAESPLFSVLRI